MDTMMYHATMHKITHYSVHTAFSHAMLYDTADRRMTPYIAAYAFLLRFHNAGKCTISVHNLRIRNPHTQCVKVLSIWVVLTLFITYNTY